MTDRSALAAVPGREDISPFKGAKRPASQSWESKVELSAHPSLLDCAPVPVIALDLAGHLQYANDAAAKLLGASRTELLDMSIFDIAPHRRTDMWAQTVTSLKQSKTRKLESDWRTMDGRIVPVDLAATYVEAPEAGDARIVVFAHVISERLEAQQQSFRVSHIDASTGLPNGRLFQERLRNEATMAHRDGRSIALLSIVVDDVVRINESDGYALGDQLVMTLSRRFVSKLAPTDTLAHMGDGEFALLLTRGDSVDEDTILQMNRHVLDVLATPVNIGGRDIRISGSVGVVVYPQDTDEPNHLLRQAQAAMRIAQTQGTNQIGFYTPQLNAKIADRLAKESALQSALERGEFHLQYQPQVDLKSGKVVAVEALVRWRHPVFGEVMPDDFLPLAEANGLILPLGNWILTTVCITAVRWRKLGLAFGRMAVNMSRKQLNQSDASIAIESVLRETGLDPQYLAIELAEDVLMDSLEQVVSSLNGLRSIGIEIALDDFGVGYSNLSSLSRLPIDVIKIDRSLVPDVTAATQEVSITRAIINMAHSLQMKVLAIGVEVDGELALLIANHCDRMQGYLFSPPLDEADAISLLQEGKGLPSEVLGRTSRKRTLLLVDDEDNVVSSLKRLLRKDGYVIVTANSGAQGLQRLAEYPVDVIVSDQRMPNMTGVEFLRRAKELYPDTVRMVLSGYTELQSITDAINEGAIYKFLTKPWDDERVRAHIQEAFHQKEMADENRRLDQEVQQANRELADVNSKLQRLLESQRAQISREETSLVIARSVLENIPVPVIGFDQDGMVAFMNSDADVLFDQAGAMLGMSVQDLPFEDLVELWRQQDGQYRDVNLGGAAFRGACRVMGDDMASKGALMVLTPYMHHRPAGDGLLA